MSADHLKAASIFVDWLEEQGRFNTPGDYTQIVIAKDKLREILAALRAVEAVRAFTAEPPNASDKKLAYIDGYGDAVDAIQDILTHAVEAAPICEHDVGQGCKTSSFPHYHHDPSLNTCCSKDVAVASDRASIP